MELEDALRDIRTKCRLAMNGIASSSMRERGLDYKLNFGLLQEQIKRIADEYEPNKLLAESLWMEETRELKILATILFPLNEFTEEIANKWVEDIKLQEMREQLCINLFQKLSFANQIALKWSNDMNDQVRTTGYWLLVRLFVTKKADKTIDIKVFNQYIWEDIISEDLFRRNASLSVLKYIVRKSKEEGLAILDKLSIYKDEPDPIKQEAYNSIAFEIDFMYS